MVLDRRFPPPVNRLVEISDLYLCTLIIYMVYTEIKVIRGRRYKYLRESVRIGDRVIHRTVEYLGPVEPVYKKRKKKKVK